MLRSLPGKRALLRKLSRRETVLVAVVAVVGLAAGSSLLRRTGGGPVLRPRAAAPAPLPTVPRIELARLDRPIGVDDAGQRDLFAYGSRAEPETAPLPVVKVPTPPPPTVAPGGGLDASADATAAPVLPPMNLRYIGSVESARGVKVAILLTDRREVLTGQAGEVVANRYRIAKIGLESVDLEEVGTGQSRRIPLRGGS